MRILLTGTNGKIGGFLAHYWEKNHEVISLTRQTINLSDSSALEKYLTQSDFDLLVNPAAISTPEGCENTPELAHRVNTEAPMVMAQVCAAKERPLIHFSTDYVLDGDRPGFKDEDAPCLPNNAYGVTKLAGERAVIEAHPAALIARVSWVFGSAGEGFLEKVFRQIGEGVALEGVADKFSLPTSAPEMAAALDFLVAKNESGLFHLTQSSEDPVSWYHYAVEVAQAVHELGLTSSPPPVTARQMAEIPVLRTNRPIHTAMKPARLEMLGYVMNPWKKALRTRVRQLCENR